MLHITTKDPKSHIFIIRLYLKDEYIVSYEQAETMYM